MSNTDVMHRYELSDCFGEASDDDRPNAGHRPLNPAGHGRQNHSVPSIPASPAQTDQLLERLRAVHGCRRYDLPRELLKSFDIQKFAREHLYKGQ
jgi:hypothetical protein